MRPVPALPPGGSRSEMTDWPAQPAYPAMGSTTRVYRYPAETGTMRRWRVPYAQGRAHRCRYAPAPVQTRHSGRAEILAAPRVPARRKPAIVPFPLVVLYSHHGDEVHFSGGHFRLFGG